MKTVNVMNFVRQCEPRKENFYEKLFGTTRAEIAMVKEKRVPATSEDAAWTNGQDDPTDHRPE